MYPAVKANIRKTLANKSTGLLQLAAPALISIRSHEEVQHISIRNRLHDLMQQTTPLAPELMGYNEQLAAGEK